MFLSDSMSEVGTLRFRLSSFQWIDHLNIVLQIVVPIQRVGRELHQVGILFHPVGWNLDQNSTVSCSRSNQCSKMSGTMKPHPFNPESPKLIYRSFIWFRRFWKPKLDFISSLERKRCNEWIYMNEVSLLIALNIPNFLVQWCFHHSKSVCSLRVNSLLKALLHIAPLS